MVKFKWNKYQNHIFVLTEGWLPSHPNFPAVLAELEYVWCVVYSLLPAGVKPERGDAVFCLHNGCFIQSVCLEWLALFTPPYMK